MSRATKLQKAPPPTVPSEQAQRASHGPARWRQEDAWMVRRVSVRPSLQLRGVVLGVADEGTPRTDARAASAPAPVGIPTWRSRRAKRAILNQPGTRNEMNNVVTINPQDRETEVQYPPHLMTQDRCHHGVPVGLHAQEGRPGHDCKYYDARVRLIPEASRLTNAAVGAMKAGTREWMAYFGSMMDKLVNRHIHHALCIECDAELGYSATCPKCGYVHLSENGD